jgi:chromosome segregation ATPase
MPLKNWLFFWKKGTEPSEPVDEIAIAKAQFIKDSRKKLQRLDELTTTAEMEIELLSEELDKIVDDEKEVKERVKNLNKPGTHLERGLLMKAKRLKTHGDNLKQRIDIYHQNIELYLNMMSRISDIHAMQMGGIDETKIASVWLEFKEELETYRDRLVTANATNDDCQFTIEALETQMDSLRKEIFPEQPLPESKTKRVPPEEILEKARKLAQADEKPEQVDRAFPESVFAESEDLAPERELEYE